MSEATFNKQPKPKSYKEVKFPRIAFDGLNSAGKTTQIELLRKKLREEGLKDYLLKGHGARKGEGLTEIDPVSTWWQKNYPEIMGTPVDDPKSQELVFRANNRWLRELEAKTSFFIPREMIKHNYEQAVVIYDRYLISHYFTSRRYKPDISFAELVKYNNSKQNPIEKSAIPPDVIVILNASQDYLLKLNKTRKDGEAKIKFNENIILNKYEEFQNALKHMPPELKEKCLIIDAEKSIDELQEEIWNRVKQILAVYNSAS
jgi:thymidylate kinase